ncbi:MAG: phosphoglucosamine mutase [Candidatus Kryptoniota bacterium]
MNDLIVSISGLRGIVGKSLTQQVIKDYAKAFAEFVKRGKVIVGRDGRYHGAEISRILVESLSLFGCDVIDIGVCPTPTVQLAVEHSDAAGGIAVTASHNPMEWNGLKFINSEGIFLDEQENEILHSFLNVDDKHKPGNPGKITSDESFVRDHIRRVLAIKIIDVERIRKRRFRVVVDCVNAGGAFVVPEILNEFGCEITRINCEPTGKFQRNPEPLPENLTGLMTRVKQERADFGIAVDPDVDRLVLITENGEPFGEEYTITQAVKFVLGKVDKEKRIAVVNLSTTRAVDVVSNLLEGKIFRSRVGEINVVKKMKEVNAPIGGEGSGGVIFPEVHYGRDAIVGIGLTLQHLVEFGGTLSELKDSLPKFEIVKKRMALDGQNPDDVVHKIASRFRSDKSVNLNYDDGLKIDAPGFWVHLRKSNTEPIIRVVAEAPTRAEAEMHVEQILNIAREP